MRALTALGLSDVLQGRLGAYPEWEQVTNVVMVQSSLGHEWVSQSVNERIDRLLVDWYCQDVNGMTLLEPRLGAGAEQRRQAALVNAAVADRQQAVHDRVSAAEIIEMKRQGMCPAEIIAATTPAPIPLAPYYDVRVHYSVDDYDDF